MKQENKKKTDEIRTKEKKHYVLKIYYVQYIAITINALCINVCALFCGGHFRNPFQAAFSPCLGFHIREQKEQSERESDRKRKWRQRRILTHCDHGKKDMMYTFEHWAEKT